MLFIMFDDQFEKQYADTQSRPHGRPLSSIGGLEPATLLNLQLAIYLFSFGGMCVTFGAHVTGFRIFHGCSWVFVWMSLFLRVRVWVHLLFISFKLPCGWPPCHNMAVRHIETFHIPRSSPSQSNAHWGQDPVFRMVNNNLGGGFFFFIFFWGRMSCFLWVFNQVVCSPNFLLMVSVCRLSIKWNHENNSL